MEIKNILEQCIKLAKNKKITFELKSIRKALGYCYKEENLIEIDPKREFLETGIHECVHFLYPDWSETMVCYTEKRIMNSKNFDLLMEFGKCLCSRLYKKEKKRKNT